MRRTAARIRTNPSWSLCAGTLVLALLFSACSASSPRFTRKAADRTATAEPAPAAPAVASPADPATDRYVRETNPRLDRHAMLFVIMSKMGIPYDYSGEDSDGMDCSALVQIVYDEGAGVAIPRSSEEQFAVGVPLKDEPLQFGDLVFFNTTGRTPSHVGVYVGDGLFAHASVSNGVTVSFLSQEYYAQRYVGARRVIR